MSFESNLPEKFYCHFLKKKFKTGTMVEKMGKNNIKAEITISLLFINLMFATEKN